MVKRKRFCKKLKRIIFNIKLWANIHYPYFSLDNRKDEFEKDIVKLLKKYNLHDNKHSALQRAEIVVDVKEFPIVELEYVMIERPTKKKE
jgi:hypothetical protein